MDTHIRIIVHQKPPGVRAILLMGFLLCSLPALVHAGAYQRTLSQHTRHQQVFSLDNLRAELMWHATWLTPAMRAARIAREAEVRGWAPEEVERLLPMAWQLPTTNFFVSLYAPKEVAKLSITEDDYWHLELILPSGEAYTPVAVEEVAVTPLERKLFPFLNQWMRAYIVRFPPQVDQGPLRLVMHGLNAHSALQWRLPLH